MVWTNWSAAAVGAGVDCNAAPIWALWVFFVQIQIVQQLWEDLQSTKVVTRHVASRAAIGKHCM